MKKIMVSAVLVSVILVSYVACGKGSVTELKTQKEKVSYSYGMDIARNFFIRQKMDINVDAFAQGIKDVLNDKKTMLTEQEARDIMNASRQEQMKKQAEERKAAGEKNLKEGQAFLEKNKQDKDVKVLPSGLQYKVLKQGNGPTPKPTDTVECHYKGTLIDGTEFDSSYKRGQPTSFPVTGVIKGWTEALQLMKVGGKWKLFIPSNLAYGERGNRGIEPNSTLIFEIELLGIKK